MITPRTKPPTRGLTISNPQRTAPSPLASLQLAQGRSGAFSSSSRDQSLSHTRTLSTHLLSFPLVLFLWRTLLQGMCSTCRAKKVTGSVLQWLRVALRVNNSWTLWLSGFCKPDAVLRPSLRSRREKPGQGETDGRAGCRWTVNTLHVTTGVSEGCQ